MFERFTDRARRVLVLAQEEARLLDHNFIGTEHLLLGLLREQEGIAARALSASGITLEAVRAKVEETIGPSGSSPTGSPPFTPRAKKVLELSLREALTLNHNYIGTEHLLLGLIREGEGVATQVLVRLGTDVASVRRQVIQRLEESPEEQEGSAALTAMTVEPPRCPSCGATLIDGTRYRRVAVAPGPDETGDTVLSIPVVYCRSCGRALGVLAGPSGS